MFDISKDLEKNVFDILMLRTDAVRCVYIMFGHRRVLVVTCRDDPTIDEQVLRLRPPNSKRPQNFQFPLCIKLQICNLYVR